MVSLMAFAMSVLACGVWALLERLFVRVYAKMRTKRTTPPPKHVVLSPQEKSNSFSSHKGEGKPSPFFTLYLLTIITWYLPFVKWAMGKNYQYFFCKIP